MARGRRRGRRAGIAYPAVVANKRGASPARSAKGGEKAGRTTPKGTPPKAKGTPPKAKGATASKRVTPKGTGRYTPPVPKTQKVSPIWVPIIMFTCLLGGMAMIILNYVSVLPKSPHNGWLLGGLGLITVGFITATRYH